MKNLVILIGNLGKNPESRPAGTTTVTNFSLATSETFKDSEGKQQKSTEWHNVAAFGKLGRDRRAVPEEGQQGVRRGPAPHEQLR